MSSRETTPLHGQGRTQSWVMTHITGIARLWGTITTTAMWGTAIYLLKHHDEGFFVYYMLSISILVSFLEITWLLNKFACCGKEGCCCRIWQIIMWIDNWKKFIIYLGMSVPLFVEGKDELLGLVMGFMMIILSTLYLAATFKHYGRDQQTTQSRPITHENGSQTEWP